MADNKNQDNPFADFHFDTGFGMWRDYTVRYGVVAAHCICQRYLKMQERAPDLPEREFCRQLQEAMASEHNMTDVDVYRRSQAFAELDGDMYSYDKSYRANRSCAGDIDAAIEVCSYGDNSVDYKTAFNALTYRYGLERLRFVLGCEVRWDSVFRRYPDELRQWAKDMNISENYGRFDVRTRPEYLIGLIAKLRQAEQINEPPTHERGGQEQGGTELKNKLDFYIAFYEQLALSGFQAYVPAFDYDKKYIADICVNGSNIAHLTKSDTVEPNPHADVEAGTIDTLREILKSTMRMCGLTDARQYFSETDLSVLHASLVKVRMLPDNDLDSQETSVIDALIEKIEATVPELGGSAADYEYAHANSAELAEGVEQ